MCRTDHVLNEIVDERLPEERVQDRAGVFVYGPEAVLSVICTQEA